VSNVLNIARWEWFKLQRRRMPWILFAILLAFTQLSIWGGLGMYQSAMATGGQVFIPQRLAMGTGVRSVACKDLLANPATAVPDGTPAQMIAALTQRCRVENGRIAGMYRTLQPAGSISGALRIAALLELVMLGILATSFIGSEYGLGTLRPILVRGTGRIPYITGKYLLLVGAATAALLLVCLAAAGSGVLVSHLAVPPPGGAPAQPAMGEVAVAFVRTWASLVTYLTIAGSITLLLRSTAAGMAISLAWYAVEWILIQVLSRVFEGFDKVADYLPIRNINALAGESFTAAPIAAASGISTLHASLVSLAYVIVFAGLAAVVFRSRDLAGAAGG